MKDSDINKIALPVTFSGLICYVGIVLKPVLYLHVQQSPFLQSADFFSRFLKEPGGISQYLAQFFMQGLNSMLWGTLLLVSILILQSVLLAILFKIVFKIKSWFAPFILLVMSLAMLHNYNFPMVVFFEQIFLLLALIGVSRISFTDFKGWVAYLILYLLIYYLAGSGTALIFTAGTSIIQIYKFPLKTYYKVAVILFASLLLPFVGYTYIFNISLSNAYLGFFPDPIILIKDVMTTWSYGYLYLIPVLLILAAIQLVIKPRIPEQIIRKLSTVYVAVIFLVLLGAGSVLVLLSTFDASARNTTLCDYYNYTGKYDKTIEIALSVKADYDVLMNLYFNNALSNTGEFIERFLEYPQLLGSKILAPDQLGSPLYRLPASDFYYNLGYISQAQHSAYAVLAIEPDNLRAKKRLVQTNILMGNPDAAQVFLNSISNSYHNNEFVKKYSMFIHNPDLIAKDPSLSAKIKNMPDNFAIAAPINERFKDLLSKNDSNMLAYEYLQATNLLNHQLGTFMKNLDASLKFYNFIPLPYEEAIIMYFFTAETEGLSEYSISDKAKSEFNEFLKIMSAYGNNKDLAKESLSTLADTYMYYVTYYSPMISKEQIVK